MTKTCVRFAMTSGTHLCLINIVYTVEAITPITHCLKPVQALGSGPQWTTCYFPGPQWYPHGISLALNGRYPHCISPALNGRYPHCISPALNGTHIVFPWPSMVPTLYFPVPQWCPHCISLALNGTHMVFPRPSMVPTWYFPGPQWYPHRITLALNGAHIVLPSTGDTGKSPQTVSGLLDNFNLLPMVCLVSLGFIRSQSIMVKPLA